MKIAVVCCLHGTEPYGLEVVKKLPVSIPFFIGNEKALKENKRFIDIDLNRCFPGNRFGKHEDKLAYGLYNKLKEFDYVIDLHSSSNNCPLFGIITDPNKDNIELAKKLGLKKLVIMKESIASGRALIDFVDCGISLEVGPHNRVQNIDEVSNLINNLIENKNYSENIEIYEVFKIVKKKKDNILINNFEKVQKDQLIAQDFTGKHVSDEEFIAVLVNEEAYNDILCLAAKKVS
ncbi:succinylglutamate desuccinylase/aspartoacylase family protein [Candidatus Pacearchaeota archaeon]|nr:succinylglutamate desuccinylase/aspartoacylase family protein [Candidatus Pacearchaeota archaeon]